MSAGAAPTMRACRPERASELVFLGVCALVFGASAAATLVGCLSMPKMAAMPMPGGWTMSMTWMRMPGTTWVRAGATFLRMWIVMMVAMMLPSLTPVLGRYRQAVGPAARGRVARLTGLVGLGYFVVWSALGLAVFAGSAVLAAGAMQIPRLARAGPIAAGLIVVIAGLTQLTAWKARRLECCRKAPARSCAECAGGPAAFRYGLRLGFDCIYCCTGLTAFLLVVGVMDLGAMTVVTAAITAERLAPDGARIAHATGVALTGVGLFLLARAAAIG
jgi:predicted metal-binding membrane protein